MNVKAHVRQSRLVTRSRDTRIRPCSKAAHGGAGAGRAERGAAQEPPG